MIFLQLSEQLQLLSKLLQELTEEQYLKKVAHLGNSSIGAHTRHIIELLQCTIKGYSTGEVDYVNRSRNLLLETDKVFARSTVQQLDSMARLADKTLTLAVEQLDAEAELPTVTTTYFREIIYNTEHTIHHLALIKVAVIDMKLDIVDHEFGMAYSTIKYQASLAKN
jgi:DinB superfamily